MFSKFTAHAADHGFRVTEPIVGDGKIHRVSWLPDSKNKTGWYVAWDHGDWASVVFGDWRDNGKYTWHSHSGRTLTDPQRAAMQSRVEEARVSAEAAREKARRIAVKMVNWIWGQCTQPAPKDHPYLVNKKITGQCLGCWTHKGTDELLVPLHDENDVLCNLQRIGPDGTKRFIKDAGVAGLCWRTGPMPPVGYSGDIPVAEGAATAATVRTITGLTTFAAMNAGNLVAVVASIRKKWPDARILVGSDNDRWNRDGTPRTDGKNIGQIKAQQAALETRALVIMPDWTNIHSTGTDWNDLWREEHEEATTAKWNNGVKVAMLDLQMASMSEHTFAEKKPILQAAYISAGVGKLGSRQLDQRRKEKKKTGPATETSEDDMLVVTVMAKIVHSADLWCDKQGRAFATYFWPEKGVCMNSTIEGQQFCDWLRMQYAAKVGRDVPPKREVLQTVLQQTATEARCAPCFQSHYRAACENPDVHWLDLARDDWGAIRWDRNGWEYVLKPEVKFVRDGDTIALPMPVLDPQWTGDKLEPLWRALNVHKKDRPLIAGWLIGAMRTNAPSFGLCLHGEKGSAKSTATRILRSLLDPKSSMTQTLNDNNCGDLGLTCINQLIPCFENASNFSHNVQDNICRLTSELSVIVRRFYTNDETVSYKVRRPWIVNGINNVCTNSDLAERTIPVRLQTIKAAGHPANADHEQQTKIEQEIAAATPHLLAVLLDAAVQAVDGMQSAAEFLAFHRLSHRMKDALVWITAAEESLGFTQGSFITRLKQQQRESSVEFMEGNEYMEALKGLMDSNSRGGYWCGVMKDMLAAVQDVFSASRSSHGMPHSVHELSSWLRTHRQQLEDNGIAVSERKRVYDNGRRYWVYEVTLIKDSNQTTTEPDDDGNTF